MFDTSHDDEHYFDVIVFIDKIALTCNSEGCELTGLLQDNRNMSLRKLVFCFNRPMYKVLSFE